MRRLLLTFLFILLKLAIAGVLVYTAYYLPGQGETSLRFVDYVVDVKTGVLAAAAVALLIASHYIFKFVFWLIHLPNRWRAFWAERKLQKSEDNLLESFIAIASGDYKSAVELSSRSKEYNDKNIFADIFAAQAAFMGGDEAEAERRFSTLIENKKTRFLGLRGLYTIKKRHGRWEEASLALTEAQASRPGALWAIEEGFALALHQENYDGAGKIADQLLSKGAINKNTLKRYKSILCWLKAQVSRTANNESDYEGHLQDSLKWYPGLTPAVAELSRLYNGQKKQSKAIKLIHRGYQESPHPDYLGILESTLSKEATLEVYRMGEDMCSSHLYDPATHYILAHLGLKAKLWGQARFHLNLLKEQQPTQAYFRLMSELEVKENSNNRDLSQSYLSQAAEALPDPIWVCKSCHSTNPTWQAICSVCHSFDSYDWVSPASRMVQQAPTPFLLTN